MEVEQLFIEKFIDGKKLMN